MIPFGLPPEVMLSEVERIEAEVGHPVITNITREWLERESGRAADPPDV